MGGGTHRATTSDRSRPTRPRCASTATPRIPSTVIPAPPPRHSCAGRNDRTPLPPNPATLTLEQECRTMPLSPQRRQPAPIPSCLCPLPSFLRRQEPNLAIAHQNLTGVDTRLTALDARLTKVDRGCQKLTPSTPAPTPNPSKTQQNRSHTHHPDTPSVNPRRQPLRHTPNNPEQIRTNLNKPEHRQAPRPDRETPESPPITPKKRNPEHPLRRPPARFLPAQE